MAKSVGVESRRGAVLFAGCDEGSWPCVMGMEIGEGSQSRSRFDFCQAIQPQREGGFNLMLDPTQSSSEPQIPWAQRVDGHMDEGMGFDADRMECPCSAVQVQCGTGLIDQICPDASERRVSSSCMPLDVTENGGKPFSFVMKSDGVLQQLFPLISHEVDQHIGRERKHPITGEQAEHRSRSKA